MKLRKIALACAGIALLSTTLRTASAAVVTAPAGKIVSTTPNPGVGDPVATNTWTRTNVRIGSEIGITADFPQSGNGSGLLTSSDGSGKADWQYIASPSLGKLSDFQSGTYDWYRAASSDVADHLHPAYRIIIDIDGNPETSADIAYLVYERTYQPSTPGSVPEGAWTTESITPSSNMWVSEPGKGAEEVYNRPLSAYMAGSYTPTGNFSQITGNSVILGVSVGIGSGWTGVFRGATDNIGLAATRTLGPDNFEIAVAPPPAVAAVPTLDIWALLSLAGLVGGVAAWRRRTQA